MKKSMADVSDYSTVFIINVSSVDNHVSHVSVCERGGPPGILAGESGPVRGVLALAGEPAGEGEGPRMPCRWGDV